MWTPVVRIMGNDFVHCGECLFVLAILHQPIGMQQFCLIDRYPLLPYIVPAAGGLLDRSGGASDERNRENDG
jgi:hypothetical protein